MRELRNSVKLMMVLALLVGMSLLHAERANSAERKGVQIPAADVKWDGAPTSPQFFSAFGDKTKGPYVYFVKFPAGFKTVWHTHDADYTATVIKGVMENVEQGDEARAKPLPAGSAWFQPAKRNHQTRCGPESECIAFAYSVNGNSFNPKTADGKPAAPEK